MTPPTPLGPQMKAKACVCAAALLAAVAAGIVYLPSIATSPLPRPANTAQGNSKLETRNSKLENGKSKRVGLDLSKGELAARRRLAGNYGRLPFRFEANSGQTDQRVKFLSRGHGYTMFLTGDEAVLSLRSQSASRRTGVRSQKGNLKQETGNLKFEARHAGAGDPQFGIFYSPSLLPSSDSLPNLSTHNAKPTTHARTFGNLPSSIFNSLAPDTWHPEPGVLRMKLAGANPKAKVTGHDELPGKSNYFIGNDPKKWRTNVPNYAKVNYQGVYPGIDLVYYGTEGGQLEYDFVVAPGADPSRIAFDIVGAGGHDVEASLPRHATAGGVKPPLQIDANGDLIISADTGDVRFQKPVVYQPDLPNPKSKIENPKSVDGRFVLLAQNRVGFEVGPYDHARPIVIDPVLSYSTYLGGGCDDSAQGIAVDSAGSVYLTGMTCSSDFPTANPLQPVGPFGYDAFVNKLNSEGTALVYSTYLGGTDSDEAFAIAIDSSGNAYVAGWTGSKDFPTINPIQAGNNAAFGGGNAFVANLNATGSALTYSTYLGGSTNDIGEGIAVDSTGSAYLAGFTNSHDFPVSPGAFDTINHGGLCGSPPDTFNCPSAFVTKLSADGSAFAYSTYLGGSGQNPAYSISVDAFGSAYVAGWTNSSDFPITPGAFQIQLNGVEDAFATKLTPDGSALAYSTYLGGSAIDDAYGITVDISGNAYVAGMSISSDFPIRSAAQPNLKGGYDAFVTKLNAAGSALVYSTFVGGSGMEWTESIAVDASGHAYVTGATQSTDFPTATPVQANYAGGSVNTTECCDAFVTKLHPTGQAFAFSTYLGGSNQDWPMGIATDTLGNSYLTGRTVSTDFPTVNPLQAENKSSNSNAFVAKISSGTGKDFILVASPDSSTSATVAPGQSATYSLRAIGDGGFNEGVSFTCTGAPAGASCTVSPNPVTVGSSAMSLTVTVTTIAPSVSPPRSQPILPVPPLSPALRDLSMLALALSVMMWAAGRRSSRGLSRWQSAILPIAAGLLLALALAGCGGAGGGGGGGGTHNPGTPAGTYSLEVRGTAGSTLNHQIRTVALTLTVS